jgi:hypothetical protein
MSYREDGWLLDAFEYTPEGVIFYDNGKVVAKAEWKELTAAQKVWLTALNGFGNVEKENQPGETLFDYFRYYARDYPGVNILPNGNFEYNQDKVDPLKPVAWRTSGTHASTRVSAGKAFRDQYFLKQGSDSSHYVASASQKLEFILNGSYHLTARVRSFRGPKTAKLFATDFGGKERSIEIKASDEWKEISIENILVSNNTINVGIQSEGDTGQWLEIDDVQLFKPVAKGNKKPEPSPFILIGDPIWHLAKQEPIHFSGDKKFYFFDRSVGSGEAISISFVMNPDTVANMTPISRIPQKGNAGWALQLTENGGLIFRIGSQENHRDVTANAVYKRGKKTAVVCSFNNGTAEIFVDGVMVKREEGILQSTKDKTAGGRLGDVGEQLQVIADSFIPLNGEEGNKIDPQKNITRYKGTLQHIKIYNRSITKEEIKNNAQHN